MNTLTCGGDVPFVRNGSTVIISGVDGIEEDLYLALGELGDIVAIDAGTAFTAIHFSSSKDAVMAEKRLFQEFSAIGGYGMMNNPMMGNRMNNLMMNYLMMNNPMMNMNNPMMTHAMGGGMMGPSVMNPMCPTQMNTLGAANVSLGQSPFARMGRTKSPLISDTPPSTITIQTNEDGSRNIATSPSPSKDRIKLNNSSPGAVATNDDGAAGSVLQTGPCSLCSKKTTYTCGRCGVFYCSRECQKQNWSDHKSKCNLGLPPLNYAGKRTFTGIEVKFVDKDGAQCSGSPTGADQPGRKNQQQSPLQDTCPPACFTGRDEGSKASPNAPRRAEESSSSWGQSSQIDRHPQNGESRNSRQSTDRQNTGDRPNFRPWGNDHQNFGDKQNFKERPKCSNRENFGGGDGDRQGINNRNKSNLNDKENGRVNNTSTCISNEAACDSQVSKSNVSEPSKPHVETKATVASESAVEPLVTVKSPAPAAPVSKLQLLKIGGGPPSTPSSSGEVSAQPVLVARTEKPPYVPIVTGGPVMLGHFIDGTVFLRSAEPNHEIQLVQLTQELQEHCSKAKSLKIPPKKKEYLAAKFSVDGIYYRATVEKRVHKDKGTYEVYFVDFGNTDIVSCDQLVPLPDNLAAVPCMAVPTVLKHVPEKSFTSQAVKEVLMKYHKEEVPLTVEFSGEISSGVTLKAGEVSVNSQIMDALAPPPPAPTPAPTPSPAPTPAPTPEVSATPNPAPTPTPVVSSTVSGPVSGRITFNMLDSVPFPPVGTMTSVVINSINEEMIMACPLDADAIVAAEKLQSELEKWASETQPYRPEDGELCVAQWSDGVWYRAVILEVQPNDSFHVMFVEYGNTDNVELTKIRPFKPEFLKVKALSSICMLHGVELNPTQKAALKAMYHEGWVVEATVKAEDGSCVFLDIPEIQKQL